jgi:O-methyltransferase
VLKVSGYTLFLGVFVNVKSLTEMGGRIIQSLLNRNDFELLSFRDIDRRSINVRINRIRKEVVLAMSNSAAMELYMAVVATEKIEGDIAEVGVFQGATAKVISEAKGERYLHLFDTFKGAPKPGPFDDAAMSQEGRYRSNLDLVKKYLARFPNVHYYEGLFPETAGPVEGTRFSLVHLDTDLYRSTLDCLEFFYPRTNRGGIIISHDYSHMSSVKRAFDEFFADKPEVVLGLSSAQCIMFKL